MDLQSPMDGSEITSFNVTEQSSARLKSPDENYFAVTPPLNSLPSNVYRSDDCNELLAKELASLDEQTAAANDGTTTYI